jgi:hypothetical protein
MMPQEDHMALKEAAYATVHENEESRGSSPKKGRGQWARQCASTLSDLPCLDSKLWAAWEQPAAVHGGDEETRPSPGGHPVRVHQRAPLPLNIKAGSPVDKSAHQSAIHDHFEEGDISPLKQ